MWRWKMKRTAKEKKMVKWSNKKKKRSAIFVHLLCSSISELAPVGGLIGLKSSTSMGYGGMLNVMEEVRGGTWWRRVFICRSPDRNAWDQTACKKKNVCIKIFSDVVKKKMLDLDAFVGQQRQTQEKYLWNLLKYLIISLLSIFCCVCMWADIAGLSLGYLVECEPEWSCLSRTECLSTLGLLSSSSSSSSSSLCEDPMAHTSYPGFTEVRQRRSAQIVSVGAHGRGLSSTYLGFSNNSSVVFRNSINKTVELYWTNEAKLAIGQKMVKNAWILFHCKLSSKSTLSILLI